MIFSSDLHNNVRIRSLHSEIDTTRTRQEIRIRSLHGELTWGVNGTLVSFHEFGDISDCFLYNREGGGGGCGRGGDEGKGSGGE